MNKGKIINIIILIVLGIWCGNIGFNNFRWNEDNIISVYAETIPAPEENILQQGQCGDAAEYCVYNDVKGGVTLYVYGSGEMDNYADSDTIYVGSIPWYDYCESITSIIVGDNITKLGAACFYDLNMVTDVTLPYTLTEIGIAAFSSCSTIKNIEIPENVQKIGAYAFEYCESLEKIEIPQAVTVIDNQTFYEDRNLKTVVLPDGLLEIGKEAFNLCVSLETINIPNTVEHIEPDALKTTAFFEKITEEFLILGNGILYNYNGEGGDVVIPDNVRIIASKVFEGRSDITSVTIPEGTSSIETAAFQSCSNLEQVFFPQTLEKVEYDAFDGTPFLDSNQDDLVILGDRIVYLGSVKQSMKIRSQKKGSEEP